MPAVPPVMAAIFPSSFMRPSFGSSPFVLSLSKHRPFLLKKVRPFDRLRANGDVVRNDE
jgi:hypothetical protein